MIPIPFHKLYINVLILQPRLHEHVLTYPGSTRDVRIKAECGKLRLHERFDTSSPRIFR